MHTLIEPSTDTPANEFDLPRNRPPLLRDESLALSAQRRWADAHRQLQQLLAQLPSATADGTHWQQYWAARAPNTPWSRQELAVELYRSYLEAASQFSFACSPAGSPGNPPPTAEPQTLVQQWLDRLLAARSQPQPVSIEPLFGEPPALPAIQPEPVASLDNFGLLYIDIPLSTRWAALKQQYQALEAVPAGDTTLEAALAAQASANLAAASALASLLDAQAPEHLFNLRSGAHYVALYRARLDGLRAEARIQHTLGLLDDTEQSMLEAFALAPDAESRNTRLALAANLTLNFLDPQGQAQSEELPGALLISAGADLASTSVLLYLPGEDGGLQRFASRQQMEHSLFKIAAGDSSLSIAYSVIGSDALDYAVQTQLHGVEQQAVELHRSSSRQTPQALPLLLEQARKALGNPHCAARNAALELLREQQQTERLAQQLPDWLKSPDEATRLRIKALLEDYIAATHRSHALLERDLPNRSEFVQQRIQQRLRDDFALQGAASISFDLPDRVDFKRELVNGGTHGAPYREVPVPSQERRSHSLEALALHNIDDDLRQRLNFMQVRIEAATPEDRTLLGISIDRNWLLRTLPQLDVAAAYEQRIYTAFRGSASESAYSVAYRRECLVEPLRLMLLLQGEQARQRRHLDENAWQMLQVAVDASSVEAYQAGGRDIELLGANLSSGGNDTQMRGVTLCGINFIHQRSTRQTVLYLPDAPDGNSLRHYSSLEAARLGLFQLSLNSAMRDYLGTCALSGDPLAHVARINQAHLARFDGIIEVGAAWPASTSLASHLVDVAMGRQLEAHRRSSRSNDALYFEQFARNSGMVFNYLKMALGVVPFVGTGIALYDAWDSANQATAALLRGKIGHGLTQLESLLLSLIDAFMDVAPGASQVHRLASKFTRQRQLAALRGGIARLHPTLGTTKVAVAQFAGYQYGREISLAGLLPERSGLYRGVYRHADGNFIISQGRTFEVELHDAPPTWRLRGNGVKTYKQPIALDEHGEWQTHGALYGRLVNGGLAGGGGALGRLADGLEPYWPQTLRERLPRWWVDQTLRRQLRLTDEVETLRQRLDTQTRLSNNQLNQLHSLARGERGGLTLSVDQACARDIDLALQLTRVIDDLLPLVHGHKRTHYQQFRSRTAWVIADRSARRLDTLISQINDNLDAIRHIGVSLGKQRFSDIQAFLRLLEQSKTLRKQQLLNLDQWTNLQHQMNTWVGEIGDRTMKANVLPSVESLNQRMPAVTVEYLKTTNLLEIIQNNLTKPDVAWLYLRYDVAQARNRLDRALHNQFSLHEVQASVTQRRQILEQCLQCYSHYSRQLDAWSLSSPEQFDAPLVEALQQQLEATRQRAQTQLSKDYVAPPRVVGPASRKRIFETVDNQLLTGIEVPASATRERSFTVPGINGHDETYVQRGSKWALDNDSHQEMPLPGDLIEVVAEGRKRLNNVDSYQRKVEDHYNRRSLLPIDLEEMLLSEATALRTRANRIERLDSHSRLVGELRVRAEQLANSGRTLRILKSMESATPSEGMLDFLVDNQAVEILRIGPIKELPGRVQGHRDFLVEFEIRDITQGVAKPLWYAHFHYNAARPPFDSFTKAHLKTAKQRLLGLQWQQAQGVTAEPIWRGAIGRPLARKIFEAYY